jgi:hypothetical protein
MSNNTILTELMKLAANHLVVSENMSLELVRKDPSINSKEELERILLLLLQSVQMVLQLHLLLFSKGVAITSNGSRITQLMHREPCLFFVAKKTNKSIKSGIFKRRMD